MLKKILWICNTPLPEVQDMFGIINNNEGWLIGISNQLRIRNDIEFHYMFPQNMFKRTIKRNINGMIFWGFYNAHKTIYAIEKKNIDIFQKVINKINPDIIHIFGTEFPHALEAVESIQDKNKIIVSIQGLTSEIAKVYLRGIPIKEYLKGKYSNGKYQCLLSEKIEFFKRGINECNAISEVKNVIGRTDWDKKSVLQINPNCRYFYCNETLRNVFYEGKWDFNKIQKYSIFVSQAYYPIKGFHILIYAIQKVKIIFPNVLVLVAGNKEFLNGTPYGIFIKKLIHKYKVEKNIIFLGSLSAERVRLQLLNSHIMVMPSIIENSPNSIGEAMLIGTPVIASNVGGIPNIINNGKDGLLYPSLNENKLAQLICKVFKNDTLALRLSINGRSSAKVQYNKLNNAKRLLDIYNEVLNDLEN